MLYNWVDNFICGDYLYMNKNTITADISGANVVEKIRMTFFTRDFMLFVFCGGMGTFINFVVSLVISMVLDPSVSYVFGYGIGLVVTYMLNAKLVICQKISCTKFVKFIIAYIPNFMILFAFVLISINFLHWNKIIVYALAASLGLPLTFMLIKLIFSTKEKKHEIANL
jgi:putative flippase GtrA